eukprot:511020_1
MIVFVILFYLSMNHWIHCQALHLSQEAINIISALPSSPTHFSESLKLIENNCYSTRHKSVFRLWSKWENKTFFLPQEFEPLLLRKERVQAFTALSLIRSCTAKFNAEYSSFHSLNERIDLILASLVVPPSELLLHQIYFIYQNKEWYRDNIGLFTKIMHSLCFIPTLIRRLKSDNIQIIDKLGKGAYGTVFKVKRGHNNVFALKYFDKMEDCIVEEKIMNALTSLNSKSIANLKLNNLVNCMKHSSILLEFIDGFTINCVPPHIVELHPFGLFGFIRDLANTTKMNIFDLMNKQTNNIRVYHSDLSVSNVMYNPHNQEFYVIDWGLAHDLNNDTRDNRGNSFIGTWQCFGTAAWILMTRVHSNIIAQNGKFSEDDWTLAHTNDMYAIASMSLELLAIYGESSLRPSFYRRLKGLQNVSYETATEVNRLGMLGGSWWMGVFWHLESLWQERSDVSRWIQNNLPNDRCTNTEEKSILDAIISDQFANSVVLDLWFLSSMGISKYNANWSVILGKVEIGYTDRLIDITAHIENKLMDRYGDIHSFMWKMAPSYVINEEGGNQFDVWIKQNNERRKYDLDNVCIAKMTFQLLNLYLRQYMYDREHDSESGENFGKMNALQVILDQFDDLHNLQHLCTVGGRGRVREKIHSILRDSFNAILPKQHSLHQKVLLLLNR